jgi:signal peptidase I
MSTSTSLAQSLATSSSVLSPPDRRRIRRAIAALLLLLAVLIAARLWCLEGLLFPVHIVGASMADTFAGPHYQVKCADCGHAFRCDAAATTNALEADCPNCGYAHNKLSPADFRPGEQVLVDRWVFWFGRPDRGDIVAFTHPNDDAQRVVKRIVGLPGETIAIRRGDVVVDGKPARKNLAQLKRQAILIHDSQLPPRKSTEIPARWQPDDVDSYWVEIERNFFYRSQVPSGDQPKPRTAFDWLSYRHVLRRTAPEPHTVYSPVLDFDAYNSASKRNQNEVADLLLTCRASIAKYGCLVFAAVDGEDRFEVHLCHDEHKLKLFQNGSQPEHLLTEELLPHRNHDEPIDIEFALCDQRVLFGMDGRQVLAHEYQRKLPTEKQQDPQLQIGGAGARIRISQARVYRDLYYLHPDGTNQNWSAPQRVQPQHYFVLGDNPSVSTDSRQWPVAEVPLGNIRGRVIRPWWLER